jgi:hypothetical protein
LGESLLQGELSARKVAESKDKIEYLKVELKDIMVSSLSAEDQQKVDPILDSLDERIAGLVDGLLKYQDSLAGISVDQAIWLKLAEDVQKADELLFKGGLDFVKATTPGLVPDDFEVKINDVLSKDLETIQKLSDPTAQKVMLLAVQDFAAGAEHLLGSLSGGGDFDGGVILVDPTDDVIVT